MIVLLGYYIYYVSILCYLPCNRLASMTRANLCRFQRLFSGKHARDMAHCRGGINRMETMKGKKKLNEGRQENG
jgi:hypothetical protein